MDLGGDAFEVAGFGADEFLGHAFAKADGGFAGYVLAEKMLFHSLHGFVEVFFGEGLAAYDVAEEAADGVDARSQNTAGGFGGGAGGGLFSFSRGQDAVDFVAEVAEDEFALAGCSPGGGVDGFDAAGFGYGVGGVLGGVVELDV